MCREDIPETHGPKLASLRGDATLRDLGPWRVPGQHDLARITFAFRLPGNLPVWVGSSGRHFTVPKYPGTVVRCLPEVV